jgi:signal transduction histidine kinase
MKRATTIRRKLITAMMLTSTTVLLIIGAVLVLYDVVSFRRELATALTTRAQILAANSTAALAFENPDDARQTLGALKSDPSLVLSALYDRDGRLFASYPDGATPRASIASAHVPEFTFGPSRLVVLQPVIQDGRWLGTLYLESDLRALDTRLRLFVLVVLLAVAGSVAVAFALANWLQNGIARPVRALAEAARRVSQDKDYSVRAQAMSDDELGLLTGAFNDMLGAIQERDAALGQLNTDLERRVKARTAELEALNRELEAFSYSVSHDLRAPLRHINGFAALLRDHIEQHLDDKGRHYLGHISDSARKMGQLIDDLLMFSRMGRQTMGSSEVDLAALVADLRGAHNADATHKAIVWHVRPLPVVHGDPAMLRLVLMNLISNAIKYSSTQATPEITIAAEETGDEVVIRVADNGVGFDMAYASKLFGVFQRLHRPEEFEGTGIGLANVRRIVQRHGGRTWAEGEVDQGATFFFSLPRDARAESHKPREAA